MPSAEAFIIEGFFNQSFSPLKSSGSSEGRIKNIRSVGGTDDDHLALPFVALRVEVVHASQELADNATFHTWDKKTF